MKKLILFTMFAINIGCGQEGKELSEEEEIANCYAVNDTSKEQCESKKGCQFVAARIGFFGKMNGTLCYNSDLPIMAPGFPILSIPTCLHHSYYGVQDVNNIDNGPLCQAEHKPIFCMLMTQWCYPVNDKIFLVINLGEGGRENFLPEPWVNCTEVPVCLQSCGNGVVEIGEQCDGLQIGGPEACSNWNLVAPKVDYSPTFAFTDGSVTCDASCMWDFSGCRTE